MKCWQRKGKKQTLCIKSTPSSSSVHFKSVRQLKYCKQHNELGKCLNITSNMYCRKVYTRVVNLCGADSFRQNMGEALLRIDLNRCQCILTHCQHATLQVSGHLPVDALLDISATHLLVLKKHYTHTYTYSYQ